MRITFLLTGKTDKEYLRQGMQRYQERISHYIPFQTKILPDIKRNVKRTENEHKNLEGIILLKSIVPSDVLILFDEQGKEYSSLKFADFFQNFMISGVKHLVLAIGGPYGFSEDVMKRANFKVSLSKMTFPHQLVRLIILEQLYRAFSIIRGEPYHHG